MSSKRTAKTLYGSPESSPSRFVFAKLLSCYHASAIVRPILHNRSYTFPFLLYLDLLTHYTSAHKASSSGSLPHSNQPVYSRERSAESDVDGVREKAVGKGPVE